MKFIISRVNSFRYAFNGWWFVIRTQKNAWIHAAATIITIVFAFWVKLPNKDWAVIILAIAMVWTAEFFNTALEVLVDLTSPSMNDFAKVCKDVGAAAVLISALASIIIGLLVLGPPFLERIRTLFPELHWMDVLN